MKLAPKKSWFIAVACGEMTELCRHWDEERPIMDDSPGWVLDLEAVLHELSYFFFVFHYIRVLDNQKIFKVLSA